MLRKKKKHRWLLSVENSFAPRNVLFCEFGTWLYADIPTTFSTAHFDKLSLSLIFLTFTQNIQSTNWKTKFFSSWMFWLHICSREWNKHINLSNERLPYPFLHFSYWVVKKQKNLSTKLKRKEKSSSSDWQTRVRILLKHTLCLLTQSEIFCACVLSSFPCSFRHKKYVFKSDD